VPLTDEHRRGVVDPIAALVIGGIRAAGAKGSPCQGTLPIYTGWNRFDLRFAPLPGESDSRRQVCQVTAIPIAGHRVGENMASTVVNSREIRVAFTGRDASGLLLPDRITVPILVGTLTLKRKS
jgi:hypothetical protein